MPEEFWPHRGAALETRLNHLENWACQLGKRSPSVLGGRMSTAGGAVTGVPASAPGSPTWLLDGDVTGPPTGNTATRCVVLSPGFAGRNTIQPTAITVEALTLKQIAGQTANHLQWADETGAVQGNITPAGAVLSPLVMTGSHRGVSAFANNAVVGPKFEITGQLNSGVTDAAMAFYVMVDPTSKYGYQEIDYGLYNASAALKSISTFAWGSEGTYNDAGVLSAYDSYIFDNNTGVYGLLVEGGPANRVGINMGVVANPAQFLDGQLSVRTINATTKGITIKPFAGQTANQQEWQNSGAVAQSWVTPSAGFVIAAGAAGVGLAPWKLTSGPLQTTPEAGAFEFLTPTFSASPVTTRRALSLASNPITADVTVANTLTETLLFTGTLAANEMGVGKVLRARLYGRMSALVTDTVTLRFKMGGTTFLTVVSTAAAITGQEWSAEFVLTCRTTGAAGTVISQAICIINALLQDTTDSGTHTVDTTAAENITVTAQWSAASVSDTITLQQGYLETLN